MGRVCNPDAKQMLDIENTLKNRIENDKTNTFVVIVPTDSARLHRQRELVGYHPNRAVANLQVYTLGNFIQRLYNQVRPARLNISQGVQNLWLHEIANPQSGNPNSHRYDTFRPSQNIPVPDSTLSLIADTINRLKEYGENALTTGDGKSQNPTEDDFFRICNDYETKLGDRWIDEQGKRLHLANANNLGSLMTGAFPNVNLVVVEGFTALSKADIKILTHIAKIPQIEMWFRTDWLEGNEGLYKNITQLISQFRTVNACIDPDYGRDTDQHQHFAENLFRAGAVPSNLTHNSDEASQITVLKPADRSEEIEEIARRIQKHVSEGDCKLGEVCVACYNIGLYQDRIAEIFPAYGIPYSLTESTPLTKSEVVKTIFSCLSSDRTPLNDTYFSVAEPAPDTHPFHPSEFQEYVENLLKEGKVIQRILNPMFGRSPEVVEAEIEAYRQFKRIVKNLCSVLMSEGIRSDFLGNYIQKLHHIAKHTSYQNRATTKAETVKITRLSELRSLEFNIVFLCDFVEGSFPENYSPDPLLPSHPYRAEEEHLYNNRFMFYGVLKSFQKRLYLLVPQREREAELIPSPFLEQLRAVADVETVEVEHPERGSVPGFLGDYGKHVWTADVPSDKEFPDGLESMRPLINHVVKVEKSREETHKLLAYEGVLTAGSLSTESRECLKSLRQERYSVTELETYASCPFQYFAGKILNLRVEEDEAEDELSSLEKGSLLHKVLFAFYNDRRQQGEPSIRQCTEDEFKEAKRQLDEILEILSEKERHSEKRAETPIGENNLFWITDIEKQRVALYKWLEAERAYDLSLIPSYYEVNFGQPGEPADPQLSHSKPLSIGNVRMKGKIDRIDVDSGTFTVVDYKTGGSTIRMAEILSGRSLQLPIYLQIARKLLETHRGTGFDPAAGLYHKVRLNECKVELGIGEQSLNQLAFKHYNGKEWKKFSSSGQLLDNEIFNDRLLRVSSYVQQYVESISNGNFPLITGVKIFSPSEEDSVVETDEYGFVDSEAHGDKPLTPRNKTQPCSYCAYKRVCRVGAVSEDSQSDD